MLVRTTRPIRPTRRAWPPPWLLGAALLLIACPDEASEPTTPGPTEQIRHVGAACDEDPWQWALVPTEPAEDLSWFAARVTPPHYPFVVETVRYQLKGDGPGCDATLPHRVVVFVGGDSAPPATPDVLFEAEVTLAPPQPPAHFVPAELTLPEGTMLREGEQLFVAWRPRYVSETSATCVKTCREGVSSDDRDYVAAPAASLVWQTLRSLGRADAFDVVVEGHQLR